MIGDNAFSEIPQFGCRQPFRSIKGVPTWRSVSRLNPHRLISPLYLYLSLCFILFLSCAWASAASYLLFMGLSTRPNLMASSSEHVWILQVHNPDACCDLPTYCEVCRYSFCTVIKYAHLDTASSTTHRAHRCLHVLLNVTLTSLVANAAALRL